MRNTLFLTGTVIAVLVSLLTLTVTAATQPWSLFGSAEFTREGARPNPWAVKLTSTGTGFGGVRYSPPSGKLTFETIRSLSTDYKVVAGDCGGGSPRFQLNIDVNGDGRFDGKPGGPDGNTFVYIGPAPQFTGCSANTGWQKTGNLIGNSDPCRWDTSQIAAGTQCNSYEGARSLLTGKSVLGVQLVVDAGWKFGTQTFLVDNVTVNQHKLTARSAH